MAIHYRTKGFVIKKSDFLETDRIFTIFTKDFGKLGILAKAIRKIKSKLRGGIQLFSLVDIEFIQGKTYKILTDAVLIKNFPNIRKDLKTLKIVYEISEILDNLIQGQEKDEKVWDLLKKIFQKLNEPSLSIKDCWLIYYYFLWNFYSMLGYQLELNFCAMCQRRLMPRNLYFNSKEGGIICFDCFKKTKKGKEIKPNIIKILRLILDKEINFLRKLKIKRNYQKSIKEISEDYSSFVKESQS